MSSELLSQISLADKNIKRHSASLLGTEPSPLSGTLCGVRQPFLLCFAVQVLSSSFLG